MGDITPHLLNGGIDVGGGDVRAHTIQVCQLLF